MTVRALLQLVLGVLAAYHIVIGILSVASLPAASRAVSALYGATLGDDPQLRHAVRMLGLYALALGALLAIAAANPEPNRPIILVAAGLQLARAATRVTLTRDLATVFAVSPARNAVAVSLLLLETGILLMGAMRLPTGK